MLNYEEWLEWRKEYFKTKDVEEHKNPGVDVVGNLTRKKVSKDKEKSKSKRVTKKRPEEGTVNNALRTTRAEYLMYHTKTVAIVNEAGEYELKPTKYCKEGDVVWVLEDDNTFTKTVIY